MPGQTMVLVSVEQDPGSGPWRVHIRKGPGIVLPMRHPELLPVEAETFARDVANAAADARRKNVRGQL